MKEGNKGKDDDTTTMEENEYNVGEVKYKSSSDSNSNNNNSNNKMMDVYIEYIKKIEGLEERYNRIIQLKRRRALLILEMIPTYRKSHARLFLSHQYNNATNANTNTWTLTLEGRLLIGPLDYQSASLMDHPLPLVLPQQQSSSSSSLSSTKHNDDDDDCSLLPIRLNPLGFTMELMKSTASTTTSNSSSSQDKNNGSTTLPLRGTSNHDTAAPAATATAGSSSYTDGHSSNSYRSQARKFTHLWDHVVFGFQSFHAFHNQHTSSTTTTQQQQQQLRYKTDGIVTTMEWQRDLLDPSSLDHFAFQAIHTDTTNNNNNNATVATVVVATIALYKRCPLSTSTTSEDLSTLTTTTTTTTTTMNPYGVTNNNNNNSSSNNNSNNPTMSLSSSFLSSTSISNNNNNTTMMMDGEILYIPSYLLCQTLFPLHLSSLQKYNQYMKNMMIQQQTQSSTTTTTKSSSLFVPPSHSQPPSQNDMVTLPMVTIQEVLMALHLYIQEHDLLLIAKDDDKEDENDNHHDDDDNNNNDIEEDPNTSMGHGHVHTTSSTSSSTPRYPMVQNDEIFQQLFGCSTMYLHEINRLLLSRQLILKKEKYQPHIILTHIMTPSNATTTTTTTQHHHHSPSSSTLSTSTTFTSSTSLSSSSHTNKNNPIIPTTTTPTTTSKLKQNTNDKDITTTTTSTMENKKKKDKSMLSIANIVNKKRKIIHSIVEEEETTTHSSRAVTVAREQQQQKEEKVVPNIFSCDVDMELPNFFHERTRDILKRIKRREFEYTSCRSKAIKSFSNNTIVNNNNNNSNHVSGIKMAMEEAISGCGYTLDHIPIFMALAKHCPPNSEAKKAAIIDARLAYLMDQLQQSNQKRKYYQSIVHACLGPQPKPKPKSKQS